MFTWYPGGRDYVRWFNDPCLTHVTEGPLAMTFPESAAQAELIDAMPRYADVFAAGRFFRRGGHTLTGILRFNGQSVFGKYVDFRCKSFTSRLRYCFMPSRGLWSAFMAEVLQKNDIATPRVLGAGETRQNGLVTESYVFNEILNVSDAGEFIRNTKGEHCSVLKAIRQLMDGLHRLHAARVTHGDLKLDNLYVDNGRTGFWDLDSALFWPGGIPSHMQFRNVARLTADIVLHVDALGILSHDFSVEKLTDCCCDAYGGMDRAQLFSWVTQWLKTRPLQHLPLRSPTGNGVPDSLKPPPVAA